MRLEPVDRVHSFAVDQVKMTVVLGNYQVAVLELRCNWHCCTDLFGEARERS